LTHRFREVRVTLDREAEAPSPTPKDWLAVCAAGTVVTFVDARFSADSLGERVRSLLHGVREVDVQPMPLRSIFTALARSLRLEGC